MLPAKSKFAFEQSVEKLFRDSQEVYFWTLTFVKVPWCHSDALHKWQKLHQALRKHEPLMKGLRVTELHKSHGIHFHLLLDERVGIDLITRLSRPWGFGRIEVKIADLGSATYLSKYLSKQYMEDTPSFRGRRRWGVIGKLSATRCSDLVYETDYTRNRAFFGASKRQLHFNLHRAMANYSHLFGEYESWPLAIKIRFHKFQQRYGMETTL
jgi:hypothetical protein